MKTYIVDLTPLPPSARAQAYKQVSASARKTSILLRDVGAESLIVTWDSPEDFPTSPSYPAGCPCHLIDP